MTIKGTKWQSLSRITRLVLLVILPAVLAYGFMTRLEVKQSFYETKRNAPVVFVDTPEEGSEAVEWNRADLEKWRGKAFSPFDVCQGKTEPADCRIWGYLNDLKYLNFNSANDVVAALNEKVLANQSSREQQIQRDEDRDGKRADAWRAELERNFNHEVIGTPWRKIDEQIATGKKRMDISLQAFLRVTPDLPEDELERILDPIVNPKPEPNQGGQVSNDRSENSSVTNNYAKAATFANVDDVLKRLREYYQRRAATQLDKNTLGTQTDLETVHHKFREPLQKAIGEKKSAFLTNQNALLLSIFDDRSGAYAIYQVLRLICIGVLVFALLYLILSGIKSLPVFAGGTEAITKEAQSFLQARGGGSGPALTKAFLVTVTAVGIGSVVIGGNALSGRGSRGDAGLDSNSAMGGRVPDSSRLPATTGKPGTNSDDTNDLRIEFVPVPYPLPVNTTVSYIPTPIKAMLDPTALNGLNTGLFGLRTDLNKGFNGLTAKDGPLFDLPTKLNHLRDDMSTLKDQAVSINAAINAPAIPGPTPAIPGPTPAPSPSPSNLPAQSNQPNANDRDNLYTLVDNINHKIGSVETRVQNTENLVAGLPQRPGGGNLATRMSGLFGRDQYQVTPAAVEFLSHQICPAGVTAATGVCSKDGASHLLLGLLRGSVGDRPTTANELQRTFDGQSDAIKKEWKIWKRLILSHIRVAR